jgi:sRNA-binding carbon storage regulator CsrA
MVKQAKTRRKPAAPSVEFNSRGLLLAGLGAASLTRKQGVRLYGVLLQEGRSIQGRASHAANTLSGRIVRGIEESRKGIERRVAPVQQRARATFATVRSEVETRLQPVLVRLGVEAPKKAKRSRQVVARKVAARKSTPSVARKARRKAA